MIDRVARALGRRLAGFLTRPVRVYERFSVIDERLLRDLLRPGDLLLIEGNRRVSTAIKYLTQSTWSHVCIHIGDILGEEDREPRRVLVEADIVEGVIAVPLSKYASHNTRICRPVGLTKEDTNRLLSFVTGQIGNQYDLKNVIDLVRYLLPIQLVPLPHRGRLLALGAGDPSRAICSTMIAQAFQSIRYPILPRRGFQCVEGPHEVSDEEIMRIRPHSLFTPRDFDLSPYFAVVKPTLEEGFEYKKLKWQEEDSTPPVPNRRR